VVELVTTDPVQVTLLSVNDVGRPLLPDQLALNPMLVLAPVARLAFQDRLVPATLVPVCVQVALHPWVSVCPFGKANRSVQPLIASPRFVTVMFAVNPPWPGLLVQSLVV
jgi:hypothetical protein